MATYGPPRELTIRPAGGGVRHFLLHIGEMLLAMFVGMALFGALFSAILIAAGTTYSEALEAVPEKLIALALMVEMTVPMVLWMRHRGHWPLVSRRWRARCSLSASRPSRCCGPPSSRARRSAASNAPSCCRPWSPPCWSIAASTHARLIAATRRQPASGERVLARLDPPGASVDEIRVLLLHDGCAGADRDGRNPARRLLARTRTAPVPRRALRRQVRRVDHLRGRVARRRRATCSAGAVSPRAPPAGSIGSGSGTSSER